MVLVELEGLAAADVEGEELQPAAARATQPMETTAAICTPRRRENR
jgi:hypothetical protein